jgi:arsenate reductase-like glutaredoxin family protein
MKGELNMILDMTSFEKTFNEKSEVFKEDNTTTVEITH